MEVVYNKAEMERELDVMEIEDVTVVEEVIDIPQMPEPETTDAASYRSFDFGDLTLECGRCGERQVLEYGVEGGVQVILPTTDKHNMQMTCSKCGNYTKLFFTENFTKKKEVANETETTDKTEESVSGVSESN